MATSVFSMATDQQSHAAKPVQELPTNTHILSSEIRPEPMKSRGRKPGSKSALNQKKQPQRGMGVAQLERLRREEKQMMEKSSPNPSTHLPIPDPVVLGTFPVFHGVPSYGGPAGSTGLNAVPVVQKVNPRFGGFCCGGEGFSETWGFVETSKELSSMPNSQLYAADRCDACFKKNRCHEEGIRSSDGGNSKYATFSLMNGYNPPTLNQEIRNPSSIYDHHINGYFPRTTSGTSSLHCSGQFVKEGSTEMMIGSYMKGNPRNTGGSIIREYEFFPGKPENFPRKYGQSVNTKEMETPGVSGSDCSAIGNASTIDLSLKL